MTRAIVTFWVLLSLVVALYAYLDVSTLGFPDGYLTPYERKTQLARWILAGASLAIAIVFAALRAMDREPRGRGYHLAIALSGILVLAPAMALPNCPGIPACTAAVKIVGWPIADDGIGG